MLLEIYLFFIIISMVTFIIALGLNKEKPALLLVSAIIFSVLALSSTKIEYVQCQNQIGWMNVTADNVTRLTNNIGCLTNNYYYEPLAYMFGGLATLSVILTIVYTLIILRRTT